MLDPTEHFQVFIAESYLGGGGAHGDSVALMQREANKQGLPPNPRFAL